MKRGINDEICFNIDHLVSWCGYVPNYREGKINDSFVTAVKILEELGYISLYSNNLSRKGNEMIEGIFESEYLDYNIEQLKKNNYEGVFAMLFIDEIKKILSYRFECENNRKCSSSSLIIAFSYLRSMIYLNSVTSLEYQPEAYYEYYFEIANNIHMTSKTFAELVKILKYDLGLIYYRHIRKYNELKKVWNTLPTVFTNTYYRAKGKVYKEGQDYSLKEVKKKIEQMGENFYSTSKSNTKNEEEESNKNNDWLDKL